MALTKQHIRAYTITATNTYNDHRDISVICIYGTDVCTTMVGNAVINISRQTAAKILTDNRRSGAIVSRNPLRHSKYCSCEEGK